MTESFCSKLIECNYYNSLQCNHQDFQDVCCHKHREYQDTEDLMVELGDLGLLRGLVSRETIARNRLPLYIKPSTFNFPHEQSAMTEGVRTW